MDNQHRKISGYRELSQIEIDLINEIKKKGQEIGDLLEKVDRHIEPQYSTRYRSEEDILDITEPAKWWHEAKLHYQQATMFLVRAVAQPTDGM
jgi:hypothetical protein